MIYDANELSLPASFSCDLCVVGSGAAGSMVSMVAAKSGMKVLVLEAGSLITPGKMNQREEDMFPKLFWDSGAKLTKDMGVHIIQGKGVGGSTLHNINLCKRIPNEILNAWKLNNGLKYLPLKTWNELYDEVESLLEVGEVPEHLRNKHNELLKLATEKLGWEGGWLKHNRSGCIGSGFCELGCSFDAKNNALKKIIPEAVKYGAEIITNCRVSKVITENDRVKGVMAYVCDPVSNKILGEVNVNTTQVCLAASATSTPEILLRSDIRVPENSVGKNLHIHPGVVAAGSYKDEVNAWKGVPQSYECTEFLKFGDKEKQNSTSSNVWIVPAFAHPMSYAVMLPGFSTDHQLMMKGYQHTAVFSAMIHDKTKGEIIPEKLLGHQIKYWPNEEDRVELFEGIVACCRLQFAAGAEKVTVPTDPPIVLQRQNDINNLSIDIIQKRKIDISAVHPMSSVPMGDDPKIFAVNSQGKVFSTDGLWVSDGSLFPTSIGVPPQLSIYAMGLHVGRQIVGN